MFRKPRPTIIESDSGFSVELAEGGKLIYREGGKKVTFPTESGEGPVLFTVTLGEYSDRWDAPSDTVKVADEDWQRIGDNTRAAYRSQRLEVEVRIVPPEVREAAMQRISMCRKTGPNLIESDSGFSVEQMNISNLAYREGDKQTTCTIEYCGKGPILGMVYLAEYTDCWDPPFEKVRISDEDWRRIGNNIREAYWSQGSEIKVRLTSPEERESFKLALERLKRGEARDFREWVNEQGRQ